MWKEFKAFVTQGNVLGLAVAVILGAAFGLVVASFTNDVLMQLIAAVAGRPDFSGLTADVNGTPVRYGSFLTAAVNFLIVAFALFLVVKGATRLQRRRAAAAAAAEPGVEQQQLELLRQIRDTLERQRPRAV